MTGEHPALLGATLTLTAHPVSDWHVGTGLGLPGAVDALVRRDRDGLPYLPGSTLTGVLRDACRTVARALDHGTPGPWLQWHRLVFGARPEPDDSPAGRRLQSAALAIGPGRLDPPLRAVISRDSALAGATTFVKPGVCIDPGTGRAKDDMLRFVEMARAGLPLRAEATLELPAGLLDDGAAAVTALLVLGAAWCDRIGGDRRRGGGQMTLTWDGHQAPNWARWLRESGWQPPPPTSAPPPEPLASAMAGGRNAGASGTEQPNPPGQWVRVPLTITTEQPVRVPRQTTGNLVRSHDHLPGSLLLRWLSDRLGTGQVRAAVSDDLLAVRHAYPEIAGERSMPAPFVLARARYPEPQPDGSPRTWMYNTLRGKPPATVPTKQVRGLWTLPHRTGDGGLALAGVPLEERSHNAVNRATQRPDAESGLYTVEVIPAGQRLRTELLLAGSVVTELTARFGDRWWTVLDGAARLGARRRGEYGSVTVQVGAPQPAGGTADPAPPQQGETFELWATADIVVRSPRLRLSADPHDVLTALRNRLDGGDLALTLETNSVARTQRRDSWQSAWQLPRDSVIGVAAGSVLGLRVVSGVVDPEAWAGLLRHGLGERRAEGFGEVLISAPLLAVATGHLVPAESATTGQDDDEQELTAPQRSALDVLTRVAREAAVRDGARVLRELAEPPAAYRELRAALDDLSPSQRGTWRTVLADAVQRRDRQRADRELDRWRRYQGHRRADQRAMALAVAALLDSEVTTVLADVGTELPADAWARLDATAALVDDLVDAARRRPEPQEAGNEH